MNQEYTKEILYPSTEGYVCYTMTRTLKIRSVRFLLRNSYLQNKARRTEITYLEHLRYAYRQFKAFSPIQLTYSRWITM